MMRFLMKACGVTLATMGCPVIAQGTGSGQARIRFMDMVDATYTVWSGSSCQKEKSVRTMAVPGFAGLFSALAGKGAKTVTIGMPPSYGVANRRKNVMGGSFGYQEHAVPAGMPTTILVHMEESANYGVMTRTVHCDVPIAFVPSVGRDYELSGTWARGGCGFSVRDVTDDRSDADHGRELPVSTAGAVTPDSVAVVSTCDASSKSG